jgi:carbon-monoxide dehydrogenase iron sulfur subunit
VEKNLAVDYEKCTGCRLCELVCTVMHDGVSNPARSRIRIVKWEAEGQYVPIVCQQCEDAPCSKICPVGAIKRDAQVGFWQIDSTICIGCRSCVGACPFGAMNYTPIDHKVFKCDLCGGDPQCVRFCDKKAVDYVALERLGERSKKAAAERLRSAHMNKTSLLEVG